MLSENNGGEVTGGDGSQKPDERNSVLRPIGRENKSAYVSVEVTVGRSFGVSMVRSEIAGEHVRGMATVVLSPGINRKCSDSLWRENQAR